MRTKRGYQIYFILSAFVFLSLKYVPFVDATPSRIDGPYIVNPPWNIGAPNDNVEFVLNITDDAISTDRVFLLYTIMDIDKKAPTHEGEYVSISMIEDTRVESVRSWRCTLIPEENNKIIFFYTKIIDSLGKISYHPDIEYPAQFRIKKPDPEFKITFCNIESIDEKQLTADILISIEIKAGYDSPTVSFYLNDNHFTVERISRFHYFEQKTIEDLYLSGDPTDFPFDKYILNLDCKVYFENEPFTQLENVMISDYNDRSIWTHNYKINIEKREHSSTINISNNIIRKIENAYFFIVPTIICFFLLGGSHLLPGNTDTGIRGRLTITLTIFVFITGSYSASQVLQDKIPNIAIGITVAEVTLTWISAYSGIFIILSLFGYFLRDKTLYGYDYYIYFDIISILIVLALFFYLPIVNIESPYITQQNTLWEHISFYPYKITLLISMIFGWILNTFDRINKKRNLISRALTLILKVKN